MRIDQARQAAIVVGMLILMTTPAGAQPGGPGVGIDVPVPPQRRSVAPLEPAPGVFGAPAVSVEIENRTDHPFVYQVRRSHGPLWTQDRDLPPHQLHRFTAPGDSHDPLSTLDNYGTPGYVVVRFPFAQGSAVQKLIAGKTYAYVEQPDGMGEIVETQAGRAVPPRPQALETRLTELLRNHGFRLPRNVERAAPKSGR